MEQEEASEPQPTDERKLLVEALSGDLHRRVLEAALRSEGLPTVSSTGRGFLDRQPVADLLAMLRVLWNRFDDEALLTKGVGIKFDGEEKTNVEEYCVSEGWIRVAVGKTVDRKGNPLTIKLKGKVEPYLQKP